jgi:hypothetical protein
MKRLWPLLVVVLLFVRINPREMARLAARGEGGAILGQALVPVGILVLYLIASAGWSLWERRRSKVGIKPVE